MRGPDTQQAGMFSYLSPEERVPATHPLRPSSEATDDPSKLARSLFRDGG